MVKLTLGIDDAGRGPAIGPMIIAGCILDANSSDQLKKIGVKDSKDITPRRREVLAEKIKACSHSSHLVIIPPSKIDSYVLGDSNLNNLEAEAMAEVINKLNTSKEKLKVIVDCPSINITSWTDTLKSKIENLSNLEISCEHKADKNHISVSSASILAKSMREKEMADLKKIYGEEIGSGYPSDPLTVRYLKYNYEKNKDSGIFRKSWSTIKKLELELSQKKLF